MPSLQLLALPTYPPGVKRTLAQRLGETYAEVMEVELEIITVAIPDMGQDGVWRCAAEGPLASALLMCDIRRGRTAQRRAQLARRLIADCAQVAGIDARAIKVEFTQHAGDEMFHPQLDGFNVEWEPGDRT